MSLQSNNNSAGDNLFKVMVGFGVIALGLSVAIAVMIFAKGDRATPPLPTTVSQTIYLSRST